MPVTCGLCNKPFTDEKWGWFTPDLEEWKRLTEEQKALFSVISELMVHRDCYHGLGERRTRRWRDEENNM